jgi:hypothetical protein
MMERPPATPAEQHQTELNRLTTGPSGRAGVQQIKNPWIRKPLEALSAIGDTFLPNLTANIPGTGMHHRMLVHDQQQNVAEDEKTATGEATRQHLGAETSELGAREENEKAEAYVREHPTVKITTPFEKWMQDNPNGKAEDWIKTEEAAKPHPENLEGWWRRPFRGSRKRQSRIRRHFRLPSPS